MAKQADIGTTLICQHVIAAKHRQFALENVLLASANREHRSALSSQVAALLDHPPGCLSLRTHLALQNLDLLLLVLTLISCFIKLFIYFSYLIFLLQYSCNKPVFCLFVFIYRILQHACWVSIIDICCSTFKSRSRRIDVHSRLAQRPGKCEHKAIYRSVVTSCLIL